MLYLLSSGMKMPTSATGAIVISNNTVQVHFCKVAKLRRPIAEA